jgi:Golgi apparatus protein 1
MINPRCLHEVWKVKLNFTQSDAFLKAADSLCLGEFEHLPCLSARTGRKGEFLACVIEHRDSINQHTCKQFLVKLETIVFSDFHLISGFTDACGGKIEELQCGRIQSSPESSSQTDTIQCLTQAFDKLDAECQHQLLRVGELQGEDFHLDRALFFACKSDREILCRDVLSGEGRVYSCLMRAKDDARMSKEVMS